MHLCFVCYNVYVMVLFSFIKNICTKLVRVNEDNTLLFCSSVYSSCFCALISLYSRLYQPDSGQDAGQSAKTEDAGQSAKTEDGGISSESAQDRESKEIVQEIEMRALLIWA